MGQEIQTTVLAERFARWHHQAANCHGVLRMLSDGAVELDTPGDGTITLRVPYAAWQAARDEAALPPPESIGEPAVAGEQLQYG